MSSPSPDYVATPLVTIGVPVHDGENYLAETLDSLLGQSYRHIEIVISDNASEDRTRVICEDYAQRDPRVKYRRQTKNVGAAANYNFVFAESSGEFFAWNAHDDLRDPDFVQRSLAALNDNPSAVGVTSAVDIISSDGETIRTLTPSQEVASADAVARFRSALSSWPETLIFAMFRSATLRSTPLHGGYTGSDRTLVAQLALCGPIVVLEDILFSLREHPNRSVRGRKASLADPHPREAWFDPSRGGKLVFPNWRRCQELLLFAGRSPLALTTKARCYRAVGDWLLENKAHRLKAMVRDVLVAVAVVVNRLGSRQRRV